MARGIPDIPLDGETYASAGVAGLPMVLEYDGPTGGYKLVVSTEAGVAINISGTVEVTGGQLTVVGGSAYGEDTPHVSGATGTFIMGVRQDALASSVGADGDYAALQLDYLGRLRTQIDGQAVQITGSTTLGDNVLNPTTAVVGAFGMGYDNDGGQWRRLKIVNASVTQLDGADDMPQILGTAAHLYGRNYATSQWEGISSVEGGRELSVSLISGSFPAGSTALLSDAMTNPTPLLVGSFNMIYDTVGGNWERDPARLWADGMAALVLPQRISFMSMWAYNSGNSGRVYGGDNSADGVSAAVGGSELDSSLNARAILYGHRGGDLFDRMVGTKETGLNVSLISGSFPGQASAQLLGDAIVNPYAGIVGGANLMYDVAGNNWERDPARIPSDAMAGGVFPQRVAFNMMYNYSSSSYSRIRGSNPADAVFMSADTEFGPSLATMALTYGVNQAGTYADRIRGTKETGLNVSMISGSFPDESTVTLADAMANPAAALVAGSHLMGYNGVTWDRLYMGISGSLAVDLVSQLDAVNDEVTAYVTGTVMADFVTGSVVGIGGITKAIVREVVNISGSGGEFELIAANGSNRIKVTSMMLIADADTNIHFQSGWTGTAVTGPMSLPADGDGFYIESPSTTDQFHFESEPGENLVLDQSAAAAIGGWLAYFVEA